ncbi:MAG: HDIG domain-containing protein [Saprospiraceae bacterium]|nr:HDIG domain-containing protein [Saprospiraceae bacterium]
MIDFENHKVSVDELFKLLQSRGSENYFSEPVTQLEHALQTAHFARNHTDNPLVIIAALLHDIGHLIEPSPAAAHPELGNQDHDYLGAAYLKTLGFRKEVTYLVANHVKAKRYLVTTDPKYRANLSEASKQTLVLQGGSMWPDEVSRFESEPEIDLMILIRICDEMAKVPGLTVHTLEYYRPMIETYLEQANHTPN